MKLYDAGPILTGLIIFVVLVTSPIWWGVLAGVGDAPTLALPTATKACIEDTAYMRANHMQMLDNWRSQVVRSGQREYKSASGQVYNMSLTNTCLNCHSSKAEFCDKCHNYLAVAPYCYTCHLDTYKGAK